MSPIQSASTVHPCHPYRAHRSKQGRWSSSSSNLPPGIYRRENNMEELGKIKKRSVDARFRLRAFVQGVERPAMTAPTSIRIRLGAHHTPGPYAGAICWGHGSRGTRRYRAFFWYSGRQRWFANGKNWLHTMQNQKTAITTTLGVYYDSPKPDSPKPTYIRILLDTQLSISRESRSILVYD